MKKLFLCALCMLLFASCGKQTPTVVAGDTDEEEMMTLDLSAEIETAADQPQAKDASCTPLQKDGSIYAFEMRFRRTDAVDAQMASADNIYFGVVQCGKTKIAVPTEDIRVLVDVPTDSFVLTLLLPQDAKLSGEEATVSFNICAREDGTEKALFAVQQTANIS